MWLLECCRNEWEQQGLPTDFDTLFAQFDAVEDPMRTIIFPDAADFASPVSMLEAIRNYCRNSNQPVPPDSGRVYGMYSRQPRSALPPGYGHDEQVLAVPHRATSYYRWRFSQSPTQSDDSRCAPDACSCRSGRMHRPGQCDASG